MRDLKKFQNNVISYKNKLEFYDETIWYNLDNIQRKFIGQEQATEFLFYNIVNNQRLALRNDIDDFLYFTDIYVQASRTEALPLSIMEALLYGIPIIGADVGGISEICIQGKTSAHTGWCAGQMREFRRIRLRYTATIQTMPTYLQRL